MKILILKSLNKTLGLFPLLTCLSFSLTFNPLLSHQPMTTSKPLVSPWAKKRTKVGVLRMAHYWLAQRQPMGGPTVSIGDLRLLHFCCYYSYAISPYVAPSYDALLLILIYGHPCHAMSLLFCCCRGKLHY